MGRLVSSLRVCLLVVCPPRRRGFESFDDQQRSQLTRGHAVKDSSPQVGRGSSHLLLCCAIVIIEINIRQNSRPKGRKPRTEIDIFRLGKRHHLGGQTENDDWGMQGSGILGRNFLGGGLPTPIFDFDKLKVSLGSVWGLGYQSWILTDR